MNKIESPILYKRTKNGSIQQWKVVVEGNAFYIIEGLKDGKLTTSIPYVCQAKNIGRSNETTAEEQAKKEAAAAYKRKLDRNYYEDITKCDIKKYFEPMLAEKFEDLKDKIIYPVFSQPKLDGIRCILNNEGMWSRYGKPFVSAQHIYRILKPLFDQNPSLIFDGELYCNKYMHDFNTIASYVRTSKTLTPQKIKRIESELQYWIYDLPSYTGGFYERFHELIRILPTQSSCIVAVSTIAVNSREELDDIYYNRYLEDGFEGQIIRVGGSNYENYRTKALIKRKEFYDKEYKIIDVIEGVGNRTGTAGKFVMYLHDPNEWFKGMPWNKDNTFESNIKGNFSYLKKILKEKNNLIGKLATIRYPNLTPAGKPRFGYAVAIRDYE